MFLLLLRQRGGCKEEGSRSSGTHELEVTVNFKRLFSFVTQMGSAPMAIDMAEVTMDIANVNPVTNQEP